MHVSTLLGLEARFALLLALGVVLATEISSMANAYGGDACEQTWNNKA